MNLVPLQSVVVVRGGQRVVPPLGAAFEFTAEEAESLLASGVCRIANSADAPGEAVAAMTGDAALAAARREAASAKDVAAAAAAAAVAAVQAAQTGTPTPEIAAETKKAEAKAKKKAEAEDEL